MEVQNEKVATLVQQKKNQFRVEIRRKHNNQVMQFKRISQHQSEDINNDYFQHVNLIPQQTIQEPLSSFQKLEVLLQEKINSFDDLSICEILSQVSKMLSAHPDCIASNFTSSNLLKMVFSLLNIGTMKQKVLSSQIIASFTQNSQYHIEMLIKLDLLPAIMRILITKEIAQAEGAIQILSNVLQNNQASKEIENLFIINSQLFQDLCYFFTVPLSRNVRSSLILVLFSLTQSLHIIEFNIDQCKICIPYILNLLQLSLPSSDSNFKGKPEDLLMSVRILSHISETDNNQVIDGMCNVGVHIVLIKYLKEKKEFIDNKDLLFFVVHCLANLSRENKQLQKKLLYENILLPSLLELVQYSDKQVVLEAYSMINILLEGDYFKEIKVVDMKLLNLLENQFEYEISEDMRLEIIKTLDNIIDNLDEQQVLMFLESGVLNKISQYFIEGDVLHEVTVQFLNLVHKIMVVCCSLHQERQHYLQLFKESKCFLIIQEIFYKSKDVEISMLAHQVLTLDTKIELF